MPSIGGRQLSHTEKYCFQVAYFMCEATYRLEHGDIEVRVRAGKGYYCRLLCGATLTIDEIKVCTAKRMRGNLNHTMAVTDNYIRYWSNPNVPTT